MELLIAELIADGKVPKVIRYILALLDAGFIVFLGVMCGLSSPFLLGACFGWVLAVVGAVLGVTLVLHIRSGKKFPLTDYD